MVEVSVTKKYGERTVLDVDKLRFERGKVYAVMGSNGSGKSTLAGILAGVLKGDGEIIYDGKKPETGYMPQKSFAFDMSLTANMLLGQPLRGRKAIRDKARRLLADFGLGEMSKKNAKKLSGGETQKLALARLMMEEHELLILDEPTAAMDVNAVEKAEKLLKDYFVRSRPAIVIVTHSPAQTRRLADEVIFLDEGRVEEKGSVAEAFGNPRSDKLKKFLSVNG